MFGHYRMPAAVLGELCLVAYVCARGAFKGVRCRHPFGNAGGEEVEESSGFMSQSERLHDCLSRFK